VDVSGRGEERSRLSRSLISVSEKLSRVLEERKEEIQLWKR